MITSSAVTSPSLLQAFFPSATLTLTRKAAIVIAASLALAISAKVNVFLGPVPFTMQTYVVLVLGALLGMRMSAAAGLLYLAEGLAGLPVFASGGGFAYILMPSFGFIVGFAAAMTFIGFMTERGYGRTFVSSLATMVIGHAIVFVFGLIWLAPAFGLTKAYMIGLHPFWIMSGVKTVLAMLTVTAAWKVWKHFAQR